MTVTIVRGAIAGVDGRGSLPEAFTLSQNYPNPFNPSTRILFSLPQQAHVTLEIVDLTGRTVSMLASEDLPAGTYTRQWNSADLASGMYFYRMQAGAFTSVKKLLLLK